MSASILPEVAILNAALELPVGERAGYLDQTCPGDAALRQRVEALLQAHEQAGPFLETPPARLDFKRTASANIPLPEKIGERIGRYKLLKQIGEGGCGVVYVAEQAEPVRRCVALKVIKLGMDTRKIIARFNAERQALALMDHPNIAKVLDAGVSETGRSYFVMELVTGINITQFCDENTLSSEDRLKLFVQVCRAIQHAHQKGVIHRDIKPSNILITVSDGMPVPKVIDFGIAKATAGLLANETLFTTCEQFVGTPAYMSPEQVLATSRDIDTRTDVYSLGVLLYKMLTGRTPFDQNELMAAGLDGMRRTICEKQPSKPSTRLSGMADAELTSTAKCRQSEPLRLIRFVRGDLDCIVMKCLEKDRTRRYETANGLAMDILRHLNREPVIARPASRLYEFQKTIQRHKFGFAAAAALIVVLGVGVLASTRQAIRAQRAEREQVRLRQEAEAKERNARREALRSEQVAKFLQDMLAAAGSGSLRTRNPAAFREILYKAAERVNTVFKDQPEVQGDLWYAIGSTYMDIQDYSNALTNLQRAVGTYRRTYSGPHPKVALALGKLARMQRRTGDVTVGLANAQMALDMARQCGDPSALAACMSELAVILDDERSTERESLARQALALDRKRLPPEHPGIAGDLFLLGEILLEADKLEEAEAVLGQASDAYGRIYDSESPYRQTVARYLVYVLARRGKWGDAEALAREQIAVHPSNPEWGWGMLVRLKVCQDDLAAALDLAAHGLELRPNDLYLLLNRCVVLLQMNRFKEYRELCHRLLQEEDWHAAKAALLLPVEGADFEIACRKVDAAVAKGGTDRVVLDWVDVTKALADYRQGRFELAATRVHQVVSRSALHEWAESQARFIQAAACARLGRAGEAQVAFARGEVLMKKPHIDFTLSEGGGGGWGDWTIAEMLRREAADVIEGKGARQPPGSS